MMKADEARRATWHWRGRLMGQHMQAIQSAVNDAISRGGFTTEVSVPADMDMIDVVRELRKLGYTADAVASQDCTLEYITVSWQEPKEV